MLFAPSKHRAWISSECRHHRRGSRWNAWVVSVTLFSLLLAVRLVSGQEDTQDFEIRSLSGEPDYKSVNLTWEVESVDNVRRVPHLRGRGAKKSSEAGRGARSFNVYYCELQNWGPHRCRSKTVKDESGPDRSNSKQYSLLVKNLRMATKYSFHVKALPDERASGRSGGDSGDNEHAIGTNDINQGQTIVIPTKGFSAHATQCLPDASEIEVETGPFFGGRIAAENGNCGVQGDARSPQETYIMRIDHEKCGSKVSTRDLTVETYITVQENLGILTHSTRRFVVVCTFQPDTLTVRARLALPGKGGAAPVPSSEWWPANGRNARVRQFNMVDKSGLVLKGSESDEAAHAAQEEDPGIPAEVREVPATVESESITKSKASQEQTADGGVGMIDEVDDYEQRQEQEQEEEEELLEEQVTNDLDSKTAKSQRRSAGSGASSAFDASGLLISACLAVILIGALVYLLQREFKKQRMLHQHQQMERSASERRAVAAVTM